MRKLFLSHAILACLLFSAAISAATKDAPSKTAKSSAAQSATEPITIELHNGWALQSSCKVKATGDQISKPGFATAGWHRTDVPTTVVGALIADKTFPDPYYGMNLRSYPGMDYSSKEFFANQDMPADSPYRCSWWFRAEFRVPGAQQKIVWLNFKGINYRANIWLNGKQIADSKDAAGMFRAWEFDVTKLASHSKPNALAVEVFAPEKNDLALTWVDWNPTPADKDMGLWKEVYVTTTGPVALRNPFVGSKLGADYTTAALTLSAELHNGSDQPVKGTLRAQIEKEGISLDQPVELAPAETKTVTFTPEQFSKLKLDHPRLWWPHNMGTPNLYSAKFQFESGGHVSDTANLRFGIREVTAEHTPGGSVEFKTNSKTEAVREGTASGGLLFKINGKNVLIRGGGWSPDMFLRWPSERLRNQFQLTRDMGLNAIRLEGRMETDEFFDLADQMGILIMPGWTCCDMWEHWKEWQPETYKIAGASLRHELDRLRNHPSVFVWLYGSDNPPPPDVEKMYLDIIKDVQWPNPAVSSASQTPSSTGPSGVKMTGPYEYVPPVYWLTDKEAGGAHGFNTETSPGPAIPPLESLKKFIPADHLWPIDEYWNYHAGLERFTNINVFKNAIDQRYGPAQDLADFLRKSQAMTYEGERAMFEAYARNKYDSTGVIQWMLNNGWPSLIWHLYDYYLVPAGGYFGTKKACEPVHVQYSYDDNSVAVVNGTYEKLPGMKVSAKLYSIDAKEAASKDATLDLPADSSTKAFELPSAGDQTPAYFLRLQLHDSSGKLVSDNFYWLSTKPDVLDWAGRSDTVYTPQKAFADMSALNKLPQVKLEVSQKSETKDAEKQIHVTLHNSSQALAFMAHLRLTRGKGGDDVIPIFWDDNYVSLLPGETREISGHYETASLVGKAPVLEVDGWNVVSSQVASSPALSAKKH